MDDDVRLIQSIANGEDSALTAFIARFTPRVDDVVRANLIDQSNRPDVRNAVWIAVWQSASRYKPVRPPAHWISRIAKNKAIHANREFASRRRFILIESELPAEFQIEESPAELDPDDSRKAKIEWIFANLSPAESELIQMRMDGVSYRQIEKRLKISRANAQVKYHRIIKKLRKKRKADAEARTAIW